MAESIPHHSARSSEAIRKLEFDKVLGRISQLASSEGGRQLALQLLPLAGREEILAELHRVSEVKELLVSEGTIPLDGIKNIRALLKKTVVINQTLSASELLDVASTLRASRTLHLFLSKRRQTYPSVSRFCDAMLADKVVEFNISRAIDERGLVRDTASKELKQIRNDIAAAGDALRSRLESILRQVSEHEVLQEEIITTREGRLVIPVKAEYKTRVPGFIHSTSASGATVFIEPAESLELNNSLRELQLSEQREIGRILADLTGQVVEIRDQLERSYDALTRFDVLVAKAKYSVEVVGAPPEIAPTPSIRLREARHPVLLQRHDRSAVVPLNLELNEEMRTLVITGPNAGGKTVAMKTLGLLVLCAQTGIHLPANSESSVYPFEEIYIDIGDEQSIEHDLSTFSSHLVTLREILEHATNRSLVLIDEVGAGTDPAAGGALAATVLEELNAKHVTTVATTHHGALKVFAHETAGVVNGSMEFDQQSLRPTYRFKMGVPGSSFAFELAGRIGIDSSILSRAQGRMGDQTAKLESLIAELERQSQELSRQLKETSEEKDRLQSLVSSYERKMLDLRRELGTIRKKAVEEARDIVKDAQSKIELSVRSIRESSASKEVVRASRAMIREVQRRLGEFQPDDAVDSPEAEPLRAGDVVRIQGGRQTGEIVELKGKTATVLTGTARIRVPLRDLKKGTPSQPSSSTPSETTYVVTATHEVDLRGLLGDEAIATAERFLDNAYAAGLHRVDLIHGKGTGALRKRISEFLKSYSHTRSFRLGEWNEGGAGVTVVELDS